MFKTYGCQGAVIQSDGEVHITHDIIIYILLHRIRRSWTQEKHTVVGFHGTVCITA